MEIMKQDVFENHTYTYAIHLRYYEPLKRNSTEIR